MTKESSRELKFELLLIRLQVQRGTRKGEQGVQWSLALQRNPGLYAAIANLQVTAPRGSGDASAVAFISLIDGSKGEITGDVDFVKAWTSAHVTEQLYDVCRRALNSQAGTMDLTFEIAVKAPETKIEDFRVHKVTPNAARSNRKRA